MIGYTTPMQTFVYDSASLPIESWAGLCSRDPDATIFHSAAWSQLWERIRRDARAQWRVLANDDGRWVGGLPLVSFTRLGITRVYSQPQGSYGGWIGERSERASATLSAWMRQLIRPRVAEVVVTPLYADAAISYPGREVSRGRYVLDLPRTLDKNSWRSGLRRDVAHNLKVAERHGWKINPVENLDDVGRTRPLWEHTYARHGRRCDEAHWRQYRLLIELFRPGTELFWWTAGDDRSPVATTIALRSGSRFFSYDGAMLIPAAEGHPMHALYETAITTAIALGCSIFDFGSGPATAAGLALFKQGWGARTERYCEYHYRKPWWPRR